MEVMKMAKPEEETGFIKFLRLYILNDWVIGALIFLGISFGLYFIFYHIIPLLQR